MFAKAFRWLASLWLTITILLVMVGILIAANVFSGYDVTVGSLRRDWYGSWWFLPLMGLLMANFVACTIKRKPWKFWQWGFLVTHSGVFTLMVGAAVSFQFKIYGDMRIQEGGRAGEFEVEGERELIVRAGGQQVRVPFALNPYVASRPRRPHAVPGTGMVLYLDEHLPNVARDEIYEPAPGGRFDVVDLRVKFGDSAEERTFLRAGSVNGNSLLQFAYLGEEPDVYRNLLDAAGEQGTLHLVIDGQSADLDVASSLGREITVGSRTVVIRRFLPAFTIGAGGEPENDPRGGEANPAVVFDVTRDGKATTWYAFTIRPDVSPMPKGSMRHGEPADFEAALRYAPRESLVWIFALEGGLGYVVTSRTGRHEGGPLAPGARVRHPFMPAAGMTCHFGVEQRIRNAAPTVLPEPPRKGMPMNPAVRVRLSKAPDQSEAWIQLYQTVTFDLAGERTTVEFVPKTYTELGFDVTLVDFRHLKHEGSGRSMKFESDLRITDRDTKDTVSGTTGVNYPFDYRGWVFYQSAYDESRQPPTSILQVSHDPGKRMLYLGFIMVVSGTLFMFFLKPFLVRLVQRAKGASDPPMKDAATMAWLTVNCWGTIAGTLVMFVWPAMPAVALGFAMMGAGLVAGFGDVAVAYVLSRRRPGYALMLGQIISAGWCINTAAIVLFMFLRVTG